MESIFESMYKAGLVRSTSDKWFGGVCGGLARKLNVDANAVRLLVFIFVMVAGSGLLVYVLAWIAMPDDTYRPAAIGHNPGAQPVDPAQPWNEGPQDSVPPRD